jgi:hypothetical protein
MANGQTDLAKLPFAKDWLPQGYFDSQGVTNVYYNTNEDALILECYFDGANTNRRSGEIWLDLNYISGLETNFPVDMRQSLIEAVIEVPANFPGFPSRWNGSQVFVKDTNWTNEYGCWTNCSEAGTYTVYLSPSTNTPCEGYDWKGYVQPGFDPSSVRVVGLKLGLNSLATNFVFVGTVKLHHFRVTPSLEIQSAHLPQVPPCNVSGIITVDGERLRLNGEPWFIYGGNWRVLEYGQNFGVTSWFPLGNGASRHQAFITAKMDRFRRYGISTIRIGLLDDGRTLFDTTGNMVSYTTLTNDIGTFLECAKANGINVEFALLDYLIAGKGENINGEQVRGYRQLIEDAPLRQQFMQNLLTPLLRQFGTTNSSWSMVDLMNEPEWIISTNHGGDWESVTDLNTKATNAVDFAAFSNYVSEAVSTIRREAPHLLITIGTSCTTIGLVHSFPLDYYALHYYPWMSNPSMSNNVGSLDQFAANMHINHPWSQGRPWVLEEYPGCGDFSYYREAVKSNGGAGLLVWNLSPEIDDFSYTYNSETTFLNTNRTSAVEDWLNDRRAEVSIAATTSNLVEFVWDSTSGISYQPQIATNLLYGGWQPFGQPVSGIGNRLSCSVNWTSPVPGACFFRLVLTEAISGP